LGGSWSDAPGLSRARHHGDGDTIGWGLRPFCRVSELLFGLADHAWDIVEAGLPPAWAIAVALFCWDGMHDAAQVRDDVLGGHGAFQVAH
jgi:hypothetical protein